MSTNFCSDNSREVGEDIIGTATNNQTYVLVECPPPWNSDAFSSKWVPDNLRLLMEEAKTAKLPIKFQLIANDLSHKANSTTLLIYHQEKGEGKGYLKREFKLENIEQAAATIKKWLWRKNLKYEIDATTTRDILVCTHGSHDKCCARYGNPFYFHAKNIISSLGLDNVRIWKSSHFGGHRFAPTMIDLPQGRYYGNLDPESFKSILTHTGDIECFKDIYRGWGILPKSIQIVERELILRYGWDWFNYKAAGRIIEQSLDKSSVLAELTFEKPDASVYVYQAKLVKDHSKTQALKTSCNAKHDTVLVRYAVANMWLASRDLVKVAS
ncbi:MAG: sucrase ferredoxin [Richelia sp. RM2_1_2]|nr:sucrase ferredoxin [Richelia sp. SM1_7_0]NJN08963.1 sucrase ferredoxin [Richelia sp. RM1_1_1]NJO26647.1 sucrase ferredoxin [Richelia sp. SL_2_1]NJO57703.1 sucrase ferredoxin [Richelia sp. RM2_1_2]